MFNINWKYEKRIFQMSGFLGSLVLIIALICTIISWQYWTLVTGFLLSIIFSIFNYFILIYLTSFCLQKILFNYKKLIFFLFFGRLLLYCFPILIIMLAWNYFNIFSALLGLIIPCLATFVVNIFDIFKRGF